MKYVQAQEGVVIPLGRQGENEILTVQFDVTGWETEFGEGTFTLFHQRCKDGDGFGREIVYEDGIVSWTITDIDVAYAGRGRLQLTYTVGDAVAKSVIYQTKVERSLDASEDVPQPWKPWVDTVLQASKAATEAADEAALSEENAAESEEVAKQSASDAEAWAVGTRNGEPVSEDDETYHNSSKYWHDQINGMVAITTEQINALFL